MGPPSCRGAQHLLVLLPSLGQLFLLGLACLLRFPIWGSMNPVLPAPPRAFLCGLSCWPQLHPTFLNLLGHSSQSRGWSPLVLLENLPAQSRSDERLFRRSGHRSFGKVSHPSHPRQTPSCPTCLLYPKTITSVSSSQLSVFSRLRFQGTRLRPSTFTHRLVGTPCPPAFTLPCPLPCSPHSLLIPATGQSFSSLPHTAPTPASSSCLGSSHPGVPNTTHCPEPVSRLPAPPSIFLSLVTGCSPQSAPGDTAACGRSSCLSVGRILTGGPAYPKASQSSGLRGFTALTPHQPTQPTCVPLPGQVPLCPVDRKGQREPPNQQQGS